LKCRRWMNLRSEGVGSAYRARGSVSWAALDT
jgi:hypothetical protein